MIARNDLLTIIPLNPFDPNDFDIVRCRWSLANMSECGGICFSMPTAILNETSCELIIEKGTERGSYGIAVQIEDFKLNQSTARSSVPVQFLLKLIEPLVEIISCQTP